MCVRVRAPETKRETKCVCGKSVCGAAICKTYISECILFLQNDGADDQQERKTLSAADSSLVTGTAQPQETPVSRCNPEPTACSSSFVASHTPVIETWQPQFLRHSIVDGPSRQTLSERLNSATQDRLNFRQGFAKRKKYPANSNRVPNHD